MTEAVLERPVIDQAVVRISNLQVNKTNRDPKLGWAFARVIAEGRYSNMRRKSLDINESIVLIVHRKLDADIPCETTRRQIANVIMLAHQRYRKDQFSIAIRELMHPLVELPKTKKGASNVVGS